MPLVGNSVHAAALVLAGFALGTVLTIGLAGFTFGIALGVLGTCYYFVPGRHRPSSSVEDKLGVLDVGVAPRWLSPLGSASRRV